VAWGLPDTGLFLWFSPTLNSNDWVYSGLSAISQGVQRTVFTTNTSSAAFFQLRNSGPSEPPILLESFEAGVYSAPNPPYTVAQSSAAGVTDGAYSMEVRYDNSASWTWFGNDYYGAAYEDWRSRSKLVFDVHRAPELFGWNLELVVAISGDMGWNETQVVNWAWLNAGASATQTITWDYSSIKAGAPAVGSWFQLNFVARGNAGDGGNVYIDNIRFED
jgi:hypothetical protein